MSKKIVYKKWKIYKHIYPELIQKASNYTQLKLYDPIKTSLAQGENPTKNQE